jgi:cellulose biosynthesis protein BcsQ
MHRASIILTKSSTISFHSYKGGTGKTTIACNCAALLVRNGYNVCLLDLDIHAPSLDTYFDIKPNYWLNDYFFSKTSFDKVILELTDKKRYEHIIGENNKEIKGKLYAGFSSFDKDRINQMDFPVMTEIYERLIILREQLIKKYKIDFFIIDTGPGIKYWSVTALSISDIILLTLKMGDIDVKGTKKMISDLYIDFNEGGSLSYLLCNRAAGYCIPNSTIKEKKTNHSLIKNTLVNELVLSSSDVSQNNESMKRMMNSEIGLDTISIIPCYCDVQFAPREYLTVLHNPHHPFALQLEDLVQKLIEK